MKVIADCKSKGKVGIVKNCELWSCGTIKYTVQFKGKSQIFNSTSLELVKPDKIETVQTVEIIEKPEPVKIIEPENEPEVDKVQTIETLEDSKYYVHVPNISKFESFKNYEDAKDSSLEHLKSMKYGEEVHILKLVEVQKVGIETKEWNLENVKEWLKMNKDKFAEIK